MQRSTAAVKSGEDDTLMSIVAAERAFTSWVKALNQRTEVHHLGEALDQGCTVERFGYHEQRGQCLETFSSLDAIRAWFNRADEHLIFSLDGDVQNSPGTPDAPALQFSVRYHRTWHQFEGGGWWHINLNEAGRITRLLHMPDDLPGYRAS